jgi:hypothetical protein
MHELHPTPLERSPTAPSVAPQATRLVATPHCRSARCQRRGGQPMDDTRPRPRSRCASTSLSARRCLPFDGGATGPLTCTPPTRPDHLWVSGSRVDSEPDRRGDSPRVWCRRPSDPYRPPVPSDPLEPTKTYAARPPTRRGGDGPLAHRDVASDEKGAEAQQQTLLFLDESGFYPLPSVVRTYAPIGQTPILRECYPHDHLSAIAAISPAGKVYFHSQDWAINSADVIACLGHLMREVSGRMVIIWDGAPIHRSQGIKAFLTNGAADSPGALASLCARTQSWRGGLATAQRGRTAEPVLFQPSTSTA